jgi:acyl dehydratase
MPVDYDHLMSLKSPPESFRYTGRETMLYALGVGFGRDPLDPQELKYVYETPDMRTVPTLATVIAWGSRTLAAADLNWVMIVHGEQRLTLHRPLPSAAEITAIGRVTDVFDKGADKGALILTETEIADAATGEKLCTLGSTIFARGDGGFSGPAGSGPEPHRVPERAPDMSCELATRADQALLYRLSGDRNPLHADPEFAQAAGFPRPILHGLCTYGTACKAVLQTVCDYDHTRITGFDARFSAPVFPGETIITDMWKDGDIVSFQCRLKERDAVVIRNGKCTLR